jgi:hypothetical protein
MPWIRPVLLALKHLGLTAFLGGLAALCALGLVGPRPTDAAGWAMLRDVTRAIFWPCVFAGVVTSVLTGIALWALQPRAFLRQRWFRVKAALLVVLLPALHLTARGRVTAFYDAVERADLDAIPALHRHVTWCFAAALVLMLAVAWIGRARPWR